MADTIETTTLEAPVPVAGTGPGPGRRGHRPAGSRSPRCGQRCGQRFRHRSGLRCGHPRADRGGHRSGRAAARRLFGPFPARGLPSRRSGVRRCHETVRCREDRARGGAKADRLHHRARQGDRAGRQRQRRCELDPADRANGGRLPRRSSVPTSWATPRARWPRSSTRKPSPTSKAWGFTNHPGLIRGMVKVSKAIKDDSFVAGNAGGKGGRAGSQVLLSQLPAQLGTQPHGDSRSDQPGP